MNETLVDDVFIRSVFEKHSDMVFRIAMQYLKNPEDSEDIMQEVFLSLFLHTKVRDEEYIKSWLIRVTINKSINLYKKNLRKRKSENNDTYSDKIFILNSRDKEVEEALSSLLPKDRAIVYLYYFEGYTEREIGQQLRMSDKAVSKRLIRSREKLKKFLMDGAENDKK